MKFPALILFLSLNAHAADAPRRNVVLILIDDLSHYGVTAYGADKLGSTIGDLDTVTFDTPCIDKLASEGLRCNQAYAYPLCENTRTSLMSGKDNDRNHLVSKGQHASDITFGDTFKRAGYATGITGKWKQTRGTRDIHGKDYIYQFGWDEFCCFDVVAENQRYINPDLVINGETKSYKGRTDTDPATGRRWYGPDICNRFALDFISRHNDQPFFLYYPMILVHDEHKPTPDTIPHSAFDTFDENPSNKNGHHGDDRKYFPDMVAYMDKLVGKVVDKLTELGIRENTLVVVMGDNGTKECFAHILPDGTVYPGGKGSVTDNGIHVPLILSQPGTIPAGPPGKPRVYDGLVDLTDVHPTISEAAGIPLANAKDLDGISFWQQATGKPGEARKDISAFYNANSPITDQSELLRYAFNKNFKRYAPDKHFPHGRFFDLRKDPLETGGEKTVKAPGWKKFHHSGLDPERLDPQQKAAYDHLGKLLESDKYVSVSGLKIHAETTTLAKGKSTTLSAELTPAKATRNNVIWESSDPATASIDKFGTLVAHKPGKAKISVYSWDDAKPIADRKSAEYSKTGISDSVEFTIP